MTTFGLFIGFLGFVEIMISLFVSLIAGINFFDHHKVKYAEERKMVFGTAAFGIAIAVYIRVMVSTDHSDAVKVASIIPGILLCWMVTQHGILFWTNSSATGR